MITRRKPLRRSTRPIRRSPIRRKAPRPKRVTERDRLKARAERAEAKARELCRYITFMRADGCCEHCGRPLVLHPKDARHEFDIGHVHEEPPRSLGGDPLDPTCTVLLCFSCHDRVTQHRIDIKWKDADLKAVRPSGPVFLAA